jgi:hypothetical protein
VKIAVLSIAQPVTSMSSSSKLDAVAVSNDRHSPPALREHVTITFTQREV